MVYAEDLKSLTRKGLWVRVPPPAIMAIKPKCDFCGKELKRFGALLFGPPNKKSVTKKFHVCTACYKKMIAER